MNVSAQHLLQIVLPVARVRTHDIEWRTLGEARVLNGTAGCPAQGSCITSFLIMGWTLDEKEIARNPTATEKWSTP